MVHNELLFSDYMEKSFGFESDRWASLPVVLLGQCRTGKNVIILKTEKDKLTLPDNTKNVSRVSGLSIPEWNSENE